jgi:2-polyprenyl-3-methyl-5-hydroxy-6-metoxy-1,4-benzoquinol methylase
MYIKKIKDYLYTAKEWSKRMYIYPQKTIVPGAHFDYDQYWKERRGAEVGQIAVRLGVWQKKRAMLAAKIIKQNNGNAINDIGSGAGEVLLYIKNNTSVTKAVAYDSSVYALDMATKLGLETVLFDINKKEDYKTLENTDYTIMFEILEHIPGPEELLQYAMKTSEKGVMFSFPNTGFIVHRFRLFFFGKFPMQWAKHPGEHLRFWTKKDLLWWLKAQGYTNYQIRYYVGVPFLRNVWPNMFAAGFFVELNK